MFIDTGPLGPPWGETPRHNCKSCQQPILKHHRVEYVQFPQEGEGAELSGRYHSQCAGPFASIAHALNMLSRLPF
ncbi:hypothetical protein HZY97_02030 [Sphingomonas sp. R-74633]|uniref:hypothetical protein n=1 Tax=Sphingomonas sp. R-74633 TaxID=2751188 RepID=UPI0015D25CDA|nr:hypothetical protein [Sphingomonas sp. R-74633]NYT39521.1 hypothetical protein [Sphingomonas sp. R-74633]